MQPTLFIPPVLALVLVAGWIGSERHSISTLEKERAVLKARLAARFSSSGPEASSLKGKTAGIWLAITPDSPTKNTAIRSYAETVSQYETAAAQWALTLPPGKDHDETLRTIHRNWPTPNAAEKNAFAEQHCIR